MQALADVVVMLLLCAFHALGLLIQLTEMFLEVAKAARENLGSVLSGKNSEAGRVAVLGERSEDAAEQSDEQQSSAEQNLTLNLEPECSPVCSPLIRALNASSEESESKSESDSESSAPTSVELSLGPRETAQQAAPKRSSSGMCLGEGSGGKVYVRGGEVVKVMKVETADDALAALAEFQCAQKAGQCSDNLVGASCLSLKGCVAEMHMERCSGDLWGLLAKIDYARAPPRSRELLALAFLRQAASGLKALHHQGYMHCDIKPSNVLLSRAVSLEQLAEAVNSGCALEVPEGAFKIGDFGLAMLESEAKWLSRPGGTRMYNSPEMEHLDPVIRETATAILPLGRTCTPWVRPSLRSSQGGAGPSQRHRRWRASWRPLQTRPASSWMP